MENYRSSITSHIVIQIEHLGKSTHNSLIRKFNLNKVSEVARERKIEVDEIEGEEKEEAQKNKK